MNIKELNIKQLIAMIDPDIYQNLKQAVELGKWNNGTALSKEQKALCMQAIIAYDIKHKPEHERVGYVAKPGGSCGTLDLRDDSEPRPVKLPGQ
jgi:uncharacterized protein YeaC (DUF1315 family)